MTSSTASGARTRKRDTPGRGSGPTRAKFRADTLRWHGNTCAVCGFTEGVEAAHGVPPARDPTAGRA